MDKRGCTVGILDWRYRCDFTWRNSLEVLYAYDLDTAWDLIEARRLWNGMVQCRVTDEATGSIVMRYDGKVHVGDKVVQSPRKQPTIPLPDGWKRRGRRPYKRKLIPRT